ncbi:MAG: lytic murein transglycosylase [Candidatus Paceibacterota bacterium]
MKPNNIIISILLATLIVSGKYMLAVAETAGSTETGECTTKESCQALLGKYESLLKQYDTDISKTAGEKKTLQNQIAALKKKTDSLSVQIKQSNAMIGDLKLQISDTEDSVENTEKKIADSQRHLATIVRAIDEADQTPLIEALLVEEKLSDFFNDLVYLENLNDKSNQILQDIKNLKLSLEDQKVGLEGEKGDLEKTTQMKLLQKQEHEQAQAEYNKTIKVKDAELAQTTKAKQLTAAVIQKIKERMFALAGIADTDAPNFEQAYQMAKRAANVTGVRPAFLLAILTQESNLGQNVGQCYLTNTTTGAGVKIKTGAPLGRVMKPGANITNFISITSELGKDYKKTAVSCPMSFGYGGAMGPGQFIPSTWVSYRERVKAIVGHPANPWNIADAFMATALYVGDYGAKLQTRDGEWKAAMIYFAGTVNKKYSFYGNSALKIADGYADDIAAIEGK